MEYEALIDEIERRFKEAIWTKHHYKGNRVEKLCAGKKGVYSCPAVCSYHPIKREYLEPAFDRNNPELVKLLELLMNHHFPSIGYNTLQLNYNAEMGPHKDANNKGSGFIIGLGNYHGGELAIDRLGKKNSKDETAEYLDYDIRHRGLAFDGCNHLHKVRPFTGTRITVVAYYQ